MAGIYDIYRQRHGGTSHAPLQNVKLPTNRSSYQTPRATTTTSSAGAKQQPDEAQQAVKLGGILGKMAQQYADAKDAASAAYQESVTSPWANNAYERLREVEGFNVPGERALTGGGEIVPPVYGQGYLPQGGLISMAANEGNNAARMGSDIAAMGDVPVPDFVPADAVPGLADAGSEAAGSMGMPGLGTVVGAGKVGLGLANGDYGNAALDAAQMGVTAWNPMAGLGMGAVRTIFGW